MSHYHSIASTHYKVAMVNIASLRKYLTSKRSTNQRTQNSFQNEVHEPQKNNHKDNQCNSQADPNSQLVVLYDIKSA